MAIMLDAPALRVLDLIQEASSHFGPRCNTEIQANGIRLNLIDDLVIVARPNIGAPTIKFIATNFDAVCADLVPEVCELIVMLNMSLPIGFFALELETREFRFYYDMPYDFASVTTGALERVVANTLHIVIRTFRQILPISQLINNPNVPVNKALDLLAAAGFPKME